jgi:hypothetical protein
LGERPARLIEADAAKLVAAKDVAVNVERVDRVGLFHDSGSAFPVVCKRLALVVRQAIEVGRVPLVLAGAVMPAKVYFRASTTHTAASSGSMHAAISILRKRPSRAILSACQRL